jgi:hypothetical protein
MSAVAITSPPFSECKSLPRGTVAASETMVEVIAGCSSAQPKVMAISTRD